MKFLTLAATSFALAGTMVSGASNSTFKSNPLPITLKVLDIESVVVFDSSDYTVLASNSTHLAIYVASAASVEAHKHVKRAANAEAAPWQWYYPLPGDPAYKKRDAIPEAAPWQWYYPLPGDPAYK